MFFSLKGFMLKNRENVKQRKINRKKFILARLEDISWKCKHFKEFPGKVNIQNEMLNPAEGRRCNLDNTSLRMAHPKRVKLGIHFY